MDETQKFIVKSNAMLGSPLMGRLSLVGSRMVYLSLLQLSAKYGDINQRRFTLRVEDLIECKNGMGGSAYRYIERIRPQIEGVGFTTQYSPEGERLYPDYPDNFDHIALITRVRYRPKIAEVEVTFGTEAMPYLVALEKNFSMLLAEEVLPMQSKYGMRLFELCIYWLRGRDEAEKTIEVEQFRKLFGASGKYKQTCDLRNKVIKPALRDMNRHAKSLIISFAEKKQGRRVSQFIFRVVRRRAIPKNKQGKADRAYIEKNARPGETWEEAARRLLKSRDPQ